MDPIEESNFQLFREILSNPLIEKSSSTAPSIKKTKKNRSGRKTAIKPVTTDPEIEERDDAEELGEFIDVRLPISSSTNSQNETDISHEISISQQRFSPPSP
jgi:hypothetical protein